MRFTVNFPEQASIYIDVPDHIVEKGKEAVRFFLEWYMANEWAKSTGAKIPIRSAWAWYISHDQQIDHYIEELEDVPEGTPEDFESPTVTDLEQFLGIHEEKDEIPEIWDFLDYVVYYQEPKTD